MTAVLIRAGAAAPPSPRRHRRWLALLVMAGLLAVLCWLSLAVGARTISPSTVWAALTGSGPRSADQLVVLDLRVPRTLLGLLAGAALGLAGTVMQGLTRNPLADPGILGVNAGAAFCVVLAITVLGVGSAGGYVWFAFLGAGAAALLVYGVASAGAGGATPVKLALAGAAISAAFTAVTTSFLLLDSTTFDSFRFWQVGALSGRDATVVGQVAPFLLVGCVAALLLGRMLNTVALGDDVARGLGTNVALVRVLSAVTVVLLCGAATAACGPISFVGLTVPHVARLLVGPDHRWALPSAMLLAPCLLLAADVLGRVVARPGEVQVGIITALIGAPVFIALIRRRRLVAL